MHSMAASLQGIAAPFTAQPQADPPHLLLSVEDGIGVVNIEGPILRKPDLFARVFLGATSSEDIGEASVPQNAGSIAQANLTESHKS